MRSTYRKSHCAAGALLWLLGFSLALSCQVPVFRYALERWPADAYSLVIIPSSGNPAADEQQAMEYLRSLPDDPTAFVNLEVRVDDASPNPSGSARMELFYPRKAPGLARPIWSGAVTMENARRLIDSPARREGVKRLLAGDSAVWFLVGSGNAAKDDAAARDLTQFVEAAKETLKIPEGVVLHGQPSESPVQPEDVLHSQVPLKIDFSVIRLSRNDPEEQILLSMLLNLEDDLGDYAAEPMAFPMFGRGRALEPLIGLGLNRDNVLEHSGYLCGACSCEVKDQNPGLDLLISANWTAALDGSEVVIDKILPPLEGLAALTNASVAPSLPMGPTFQDTPLAPRLEAESNSLWIWGTTVLLIIGAIAAGSWILIFKRKTS